MSGYTIYALRGSGTTDRDASTFRSLQEGVGRFGWSYVETADLGELQRRIHAGDSLTEEERDCRQRFLLDIKKCDYVVYINIPEWGKCTLGRVKGPYYWRWEDEDFNHRFPVDPASVRVFDRNDAIVHPQLSSKLKLQGRWWRINGLHGEFESLIESLREGRDGRPRTIEANLHWLKNEIQSDLESITVKIHKSYPGSELEKPIAAAFRNVPGVKEVKEQGGSGEQGADLLVVFEWEIPVAGIQEERTCVVQVKSFGGEMWETKAVNQIRRALQYWDADMGVIVSTASSGSEALDNALDTLREELRQESREKPVYLLIGEDVAAFLLRYGIW